MKLWVGIDPGVNGAMAWVLEDGTPGCWDTRTAKIKGESAYDIHAMAVVVRDMSVGARAIIEAIAPRPPTGIRQAAKQGEGFGIWRALLTTCNVPFEVVPAATWKAHAPGGSLVKKGARVPDKELKEASVLRAKELFGDLSWLSKHDRAEALLLAEYLRRRG